MILTLEASLALMLLLLAVPAGRGLWPRVVREVRDRFHQTEAPTQEDYLIGFPLFIVFCGILMGWMLLFIGVVRQGLL